MATSSKLATKPNAPSATISKRQATESSEKGISSLQVKSRRRRQHTLSRPQSPFFTKRQQTKRGSPSKRRNEVSDSSYSDEYDSDDDCCTIYYEEAGNICKLDRLLCIISCLVTLVIIMLSLAHLQIKAYGPTAYGKYSGGTRNQRGIVVPPPSNYKAMPLELIHIPKTGGTSMEMAMAQTKRRWGACKFLPRTLSITASNAELACPGGRPPLPLEEYKARFRKWDKFSQNAPPWHLPPWRYDSLSQHLLPQYLVPTNATRSNISNQEDSNAIQAPWLLHPYQNASLFAVVRNPYDRILSEYYFTHFVEGNGNAVASPKHLNLWAQPFLKSRLKYHLDVQLAIATRMSQNTTDDDDEPRLPLPWNKLQYAFKAGHWISQFEFCFAPPSYITQSDGVFKNMSSYISETVGNTTQYKSLYDDWQPYIHHVLKFENLREDFAQLMAQYNLSDTVQLEHVHSMEAKLTKTDADEGKNDAKKKETSGWKTLLLLNKSKNKSHNTTQTGSTKNEKPTSKMTRDAFTDRTKQMIEFIYAKDFEVFGYTKESNGPKADDLWSDVPPLRTPGSQSKVPRRRKRKKYYDQRRQQKKNDAVRNVGRNGRGGGRV